MRSRKIPVTREQAITVLARNLRLEEAAGEVTNFRDGHDFASWSRGYIKTAVNRGLVNGYEDGSFRPASDITRGEMSKLLSDAIGTLVDTEGTNDLGSVWGNVTITTPHTTLRNTTVGGDLYLTSGVGLGDVTLENVRVLGRISCGRRRRKRGRRRQHYHAQRGRAGNDYRHPFRPIYFRQRAK